jgi:hypothetical protein
MVRVIVISNAFGSKLIQMKCICSEINNLYTIVLIVDYFVNICISLI